MSSLLTCHPDRSRKNALKNILLLLIAGGLKAVLTIITFGMSIPAGILTPAMAIGACVGRAVGMMVQVWQEYVLL